MNDEFTAYDSVGLRVAAAFETTGLPKTAHLLLECRDDGIDELLLLRQDVLLGQPEPFIRASPVDECRDCARDGIAQHRVEAGPHERIEATLELHELERQVGENVQKRRSGVGGGNGPGGVLN